MKYFLLIVTTSIFLNTASGISQDFKSLNLQSHYDFKREHPTATLEYLGFDKLGSWFFFIDFNFNHTVIPGIAGKKGGLSDTYFEIMRYFQVSRLGPHDLNLTIQYNDGSEPVKQVWLGGINLSNIQLENVNISTEFLLKKEYKLGINWQYTLVWFAEFFKGKLVFNGYLDFWINDNENEYWPSFDPEFAATKYSFQTEPQLGYVLSPHWKLGTELEISRGFLGALTGKLALSEKYKHDEWYFLPTVFLQYNF